MTISVLKVFEVWIWYYSSMLSFNLSLKVDFGCFDI